MRLRVSWLSQVGPGSAIPISLASTSLLSPTMSSTLPLVSPLSSVRKALLPSLPTLSGSRSFVVIVLTRSLTLLLADVETSLVSSFSSPPPLPCPSPHRILSLEKLGVIFNQVATPLQFTPRKLVVHPPTGNLVLIETDHSAFTEATKAQRKQLMAEVCLAVPC